MTNEELKINLKYLIDKYVQEDQKDSLYSYIIHEDIPVKGVLADLNKYKTRALDQADSDLIKNIYFYNC
ncbi:hypothetical protein [Limnobaculum parvum]|uniref:Uncharacterized protein n=1 Tax=Limnobaculum parvum TaxID=2172103 RepID=A0A2Y9TY62_9GAMM|nr:hypothetical protein [Limnobaculum parvum]AWH88636.1 hypothetical protein HYN51_08720 [Limnobaculum parvum]